MKKLEFSVKRSLWTLAILTPITVALVFAGHYLREARPTLGEGGSVASENARSSGAATASESALNLQAIDKPAEREAALESAASVLYKAPTAIEGLRQIEAIFGASDFEVNRLKLAVMGLCQGPVDPAGSLLMNEPDPTRDWVIEAVVAYCKGWSLAANAPRISENEPESLMSIGRRGGAESAILAAQARVARSSDWMDLNESALLLSEQGRLPRPSQLGLSDSDFGPVDINHVLADATYLLSCDLAGGCGTQSLPMLRYCLSNGCRRDSTLLEAMRDNSPARQHELMLAYRKWLLGQRK